MGHRSMKDKVCMITGATSGIGRSLSIELSRLGARVVIVGRSLEKCEAVRHEIIELGGLEPVILQCDLGSLSQVEKAAASFLAMDLPLHTLINNAGAVNQSRQVTEDGLEQTIAVSYFAGFKLTALLLDKLKSSGQARILNITSNSYPLGKLDFDNLNFDRKYGPMRAYSTSKLAMIQFSRRLARHLEGTDLTVNAVHPGMIYTNIGISNNTGWLARVSNFVWKMIAEPLEEAHKTTLYAAVSRELEGVSGQYIANSAVAKLHTKALCDKTAEKLWKVSQTITGTAYP